MIGLVSVRVRFFVLTSQDVEECFVREGIKDAFDFAKENKDVVILWKRAHLQTLNSDEGVPNDCK